MDGEKCQTDRVTTFSFAGNSGKFTCSRTGKTSDGETIGYHPNGALFFRCQTRNGFSHGICNMWDETGRHMARQLYFRGSPVETAAQFLRTKSETLTAKDIITIMNATIRRAFLEEFGYGRFLKEMPHVVIDKDGEEELVKISWYRKEEPIYLVRVRCPSLGVFYTLRVPPSMRTAKEAVAWTFGMEEKEYLPEQET